MTFDLDGQGTMRPSRLEYPSVHEDGALLSGGHIEVDGLCRVSAPEDDTDIDGFVREPAHWAVCLFPRGAKGNVVG